MAAPPTKVSLYEQSEGDKLLDKVKKNPLVPLGIAGMFGMVAHGAYGYKNRGGMSTSMYLMQLRVRAQSVVVGFIAAGVAYQLLNEYVFHKKAP